MNRAIFIATVMVGIIGMLLVSQAAPALSSEPENTCVKTRGDKGDIQLVCDIPVIDGQHVLIRGASSHGVCHYDANDDGAIWSFTVASLERGNDCQGLLLPKGSVLPQS